MEYSKECPFCMETRFINNKIANLPSESCILYENENLYVGVDISPLCEGHILIITKKHYLNFYETPKYIKKDVIRLINKIKQVYKEVYHQDILLFEHGSAFSGQAGSSIDHAHLHCIPHILDIDLGKRFPNKLNCNILEEYNFKNEFSYLYIATINSKTIYKVEQLPSQFLRSIIAEKLNSKEYLWQKKCSTSDSITNLNRTIEKLKGKISI